MNRIAKVIDLVGIVAAAAPQVVGTCQAIQRVIGIVSDHPVV